MDRSSGKKSNTWGLGIELDVQRRDVDFQQSIKLLNQPGGSGQDAKSSPSSARIENRQGMSFVALWSQGAEDRRIEIRRRMGLFLLFAQAAADAAPQTAISWSQQSTQVIPQAVLPTLSTALTYSSSLPGLLSASPLKVEEAPASAPPSCKASTTKQRASSLLDRVRGLDQTLLRILISHCRLRPKKAVKTLL